MGNRGVDETPVRLDKWLWATRFFKTRSLAAQEIERGRVQVNATVAKASREVRLNDVITLRQGNVPVPRVVIVRGVSGIRRSAPLAQQLFEETADSVAARARYLAERAAQPGAAIEHGRPTKRDRRQLVQWERWSAVARKDE